MFDPKKVLQVKTIEGKQGAYVAVSWQCGWVGVCTRPQAHRGQHGGLRRVETGKPSAP
jgi:hypothetical protein